MKYLRYLLVLTAIAIVTPAAARAEPCLIKGATKTGCGAPQSPNLIRLSDQVAAPAGTPRIFRPGRAPSAVSGTAQLARARLIRPYPAARTCTGSIRRIPDQDGGPIRYEICLDELAGVSAATASETYRRLAKGASRVCRLNGADSAEARKYCVRDTLYRAVLDAQRPALTSYYSRQTGRDVPRIEVQGKRLRNVSDF